jgi:hypothetical protein
MRHISDEERKKSGESTIRVSHGAAEKTALNERRIPDARGARVPLGMGYDRARGVGRGCRNGRVRVLI